MRDTCAACGRPEPVDPADVHVGDVVEVEADDGAWMIRGEVADVDDPHGDGPSRPDRPIGLRFGQMYAWPEIDRATVRVLRRAAQEPDPEQVEALAEALQDTYDGDVARWGALTEHAREPYRTRARRLIRRGVRVDGGTDG